ncbi:hypothetical protein ACHAXT_005655 [Thalassiosira profunda]
MHLPAWLRWLAPAANSTAIAAVRPGAKGLSTDVGLSGSGKFDSSTSNAPSWVAGVQRKLQCSVPTSTTDFYEGEMKGGKPHGKGKLTWTTGYIYDGEWRDGERDGWGKMTFAEGGEYEGEWILGVRDGVGTVKRASGDEFDGEWASGERHGTGMYKYFASGNVYEGEWLRGKRHGKGTFRYAASGDIFVGEWLEDKKHGWGELTDADGHCTGEWKAGKMHGKGKMTYLASGDMYEGEFVAGKRGGMGKYTWASGDTYVGEWKDSVEHGQGKATWVNGDSYEGSWRDGTFHGNGTHKWGDTGDVFIGEWKDGKKHGRGKFKTTDGDFFNGEWREDMRHGHGMQEYADGDELVYEGEWEKDMPHGRGRCNYVSGEAYEGDFRKGKKYGWGAHTYANGDVFDGPWVNDHEHGKGTWTLPNGNRYDGQWEDGLLHGVATYSDAATGLKINQTYMHGELLAGELITSADTVSTARIPKSSAKGAEKAVQESQAARSTGPSADEIAKYPKWELNALHRSRTEGDVQVFNEGDVRVFNKDGKAIAAQWSAASRTWIEVGEVTGANANAGTLNGQRYDHVLPIEIDVRGGGVQTLQVGYNNGENPVVTAQAFIDDHMLDQNYLAQIADYIQQRAGQLAPPFGVGGAGGGGSTGYSDDGQMDTGNHVTKTYANGDKYVGEMKDGMMHGKGTLSYGSGDFCDGEWKNGVLDGTGKYIWAIGVSYSGQWKQNKRWGKGIMKWDQGEWSGDVHDGEWKDDQRHGKGTYTTANGDVFVGAWRDGLLHGDATFTSALTGYKFDQTYNKGRLTSGTLVAMAISLLDQSFEKNESGQRLVDIFVAASYLLRAVICFLLENGVGLGVLIGIGAALPSLVRLFRAIQNESEDLELPSPKRKREKKRRKKKAAASVQVVVLSDELKTCGICMNEFSTDMDGDEETKKMLPVLSTCGHTYCHGCVLGKQAVRARADSGRVPKTIDCMYCRKENAFCPLEPTYNRQLIEILQSSVPLSEAGRRS